MCRLTHSSSDRSGCGLGLRLDMGQCPRTQELRTHFWGWGTRHVNYTCMSMCHTCMSMFRHEGTCEEGMPVLGGGSNCGGGRGEQHCLSTCQRILGTCVFFLAQSAKSLCANSVFNAPCTYMHVTIQPYTRGYRGCPDDLTSPPTWSTTMGPVLGVGNGLWPSLCHFVVILKHHLFIACKGEKVTISITVKSVNSGHPSGSGSTKLERWPDYTGQSPLNTLLWNLTN